jgi:SAM-dependent methyltransferase
MASWADDAAKNRDVWTKSNAEYTNRRARDAWAKEEIDWGVWDAREADLDVLGDVDGLDVVELGCGTAYFSAWLAKRGARPVGVDITPAQLETARRMQAETGLEFPLVEADAGATGLPAESFDLALSEYGASIWVDPYRWVPEAARLLRPGGRLVFLRNSTLAILCVPDDDALPSDERLHRPQRGLRRLAWQNEDEGVEYHLGHGEWIDLLRANGFEIERLVEIYADEDAREHPYYTGVTADWAKRWPAEEIWVGRKRP